MLASFFVPFASFALLAEGGVFVGWRVFGEGDAVVFADVGEGFAAEGFGFEGGAQVCEVGAAGSEVAVEGAVGDAGELGKLGFSVGSVHE